MSTDVLAKRAYNFSAGPAVLPEAVLERIRDEMLCLPGVGASILEISHRSGAFGDILNDASQRFRDVLSVPDDYEILFLQGGASLQNAMIPANLCTDQSQVADYIITGAWGKKSSQEVHHYGTLNVAWDGAESKYNHLPRADELKVTEGAAYLHLTSNETIHGVQFRQLPETSVPIVADMSSDILSRPLNVSDYGLIYACAQKNAGVAGLATIVIRKDLMARGADRLPKYLDYSKHAAAHSMANTPPTFAIYVTGLVCRWIQEDIGGLEKMQELNEHKASILYDLIDQQADFYRPHARESDRSMMNVVFTTPSELLDKQFVSEAAAAGMITLKGHRSLGGIRASIYNAMPIDGVNALAEFMKDFSQKNG